VKAHTSSSHPSRRFGSAPRPRVPSLSLPYSLHRGALAVLFSQPCLLSATPSESVVPRTRSSEHPNLRARSSFLIHSIRLQYLRHSEDPYAARLVSFSPSYASNPYITTSSLADTERWPELNAPSSPAPSDDEGAGALRVGASGFPGARLKHSETIMGGRAGSVGMRVSGKRSSAYRPRSIRV
jgi:hypothetical protein